MAITIDQNPVADEGFAQVGDVLGKIARQGRLVMRLLIDGETPDMGRLDEVRRIAVAGRHIYVETADPSQAAVETLTGAEERLEAADKLRGEAVKFLRGNKLAVAMNPLAECMGAWLAVQRAMGTVAGMFKFDLEKMEVEGKAMSEISGVFAEQLRRIQAALGYGDCVELIDLMAYETQETMRKWGVAINQLKVRVLATAAVRSAT